MNPGGSVKDRAAIAILTDAEEKGLLTKGGTIVEGTAGNTGIGLAHLAAARGYRCVIFLPETQSREKIELLVALGADVRPVPAVPYEDPQNYNHQAERYAQEVGENCVWTNQFDNVANRYGHFSTTGPEIFGALGKQLDAFVCATGTGGSLAGVGMYLKSRHRDCKIVLADPPGSALYSHFTKGVLERTGTSITEGIGQGRITANLEGAPIDDALHIPDPDSLRMVFRLLTEEGIYVGASSALNAEAARQLALKLGPGHTICTLLCDSATRYQSRLFSRSFLESKGLLSELDVKYHRHLSP
jgi:cysteine synthase A